MLFTDKKMDNVSTCTDPGEGQADKNLQLEESSLHESLLEVSNLYIVLFKCPFQYRTFNYKNIKRY